MPVTWKSLECDMIAFNAVVSVLFVDVRDVIKGRIISMIYVANDLAVGRCFVRTD